MRTYFDDSIEVLTAIVREGIHLGELRAVDPRKTAVTIAALYEGLVLIWVANQRALDLDQSWRHATAQALSGLLRLSSPLS